jgi:hypothetical protein
VAVGAEVVAIVAILGNVSVVDVYVGLISVATPQARSSPSRRARRLQPYPMSKARFTLPMSERGR